MKKIILIALDWIRPKDPPFSLGHASILANLIKHNIDVIPKSWTVNNPNFSADEVVDFTMQHASENTDFAIGAFIWNEKYTQEILNKLKKYRFPGRIIVGGPQISYVKNNVEKYYPQADIFIRGYAEEALAKLLKASHESFPMIKGVHYANQPDLGLSASIDFETLPSPFLTGIIQPQRFIRWETQRGCPFRCAFCQHRGSDETKTRKNFSQPRVIEEAKWITDHTIIQDIAVLDPIFNSGDRYLQALEVLNEGKYTGKLALQARIEMVKPEFLDIIEKLNQTGKVVLEFGLQTIHKEEQRIIERPNNMKKVKELLQEVTKRNIEMEISLILGLPNQTVESFKQSVDFCKEMNIKTIHAYPLKLLRGTPLYDAKLPLKLVESADLGLSEVDQLYDGIPVVVSAPSFSYEEWQKMVGISLDLERDNRNSKPVSLAKAPTFFPVEQREDHGAVFLQSLNK